MRTIDVIKKPILSEKAHHQMEKGIYTFLVAKHATKKNVSISVKNQFGVDSIKVNIAKLHPKAKRITGTRKQTLVGGGKKAIVQLKSGQSIPMLSPKTESKKGQKPKKEKDVQTSPEGKEG